MKVIRHRLRVFFIFGGFANFFATVFHIALHEKRRIFFIHLISKMEIAWNGVLTSSNCKHLPHSCRVIRWSSSGSHDSKKGAIQCSRDINGARIGKSSWIDTDRSCGCPSKSHHFQMAALVQRRVKFDSASNCRALYCSGKSPFCAMSFITLKSQSRIRRGKSPISSSVQTYHNLPAVIVNCKYYFGFSGQIISRCIFLFTGISLHWP